MQVTIGIRGKGFFIIILGMLFEKECNLYMVFKYAVWWFKTIQDLPKTSLLFDQKFIYVLDYRTVYLTVLKHLPD